MVEIDNGRAGTTMLDEAMRGSGSGAMVAKCDPVAASLFLLDGRVRGVGVVKHRGVVPAEEGRLEIWKECVGGGEVKLHVGFLALAHCDGRPLLVPAGAVE